MPPKKISIKTQEELFYAAQRAASNKDASLAKKIRKSWLSNPQNRPIEDVFPISMPGFPITGDRLPNNSRSISVSFNVNGLKKLLETGRRFECPTGYAGGQIDVINSRNKKSIHAVNQFSRTQVFDALKKWEIASSHFLSFQIKDEIQKGIYIVGCEIREVGQTYVTRNLEISVICLPSFFGQNIQSYGKPFFINTHKGLQAYQYWVILHELGHGVGLQHPDNAIMELASDRCSFSVMAYPDKFCPPFIQCASENTAWYDCYGLIQESISTPGKLDINSLANMYNNNTLPVVTADTQKTLDVDQFSENKILINDFFFIFLYSMMSELLNTLSKKNKFFHFLFLATTISGLLLSITNTENNENTLFDIIKYTGIQLLLSILSQKFFPKKYHAMIITPTISAALFTCQKASEKTMSYQACFFLASAMSVFFGKQVADQLTSRIAFFQTENTQQSSARAQQRLPVRSR